MPPSAVRCRILSADAAAIDAAAEILREGGLVGMPTETVYGLAGDATNPAAVERIYVAKGRPRINPLIAHIPDLQSARLEGIFPPLAIRLAEVFWPGPLTLVVPLAPTSQVCELARAGLPSIALRVPAHPVAQALLAAFGRPLVAPSANRSGHVTATRVQHVAEDLGDAVRIVLDAGPSPHGLESTIIAVSEDEVLLLRPGAVPAEDIASVAGLPPLRRADPSAAIQAPGQLPSHYAPQAALRLGALSPRDGEGFLGFGACSHGAFNLSPAGDVTEAARNLFWMLREMDRLYGRIAVAPIPHDGVGAALNDRLVRAATGR